jgi:hypothetical protein
LLLNARSKIKIVYSVSLSIVVVNVTVIVVNLLLVTTIKYFVVATIFFVSTTISDQSLSANPSELSVRKITGLWQKHHSRLINELHIFYKRTALYKKSNSPLEKKAFPFFHERTAHFSETQSPFLREVFSKWKCLKNQEMRENLGLDELPSSCRRVVI